MKKNEDEVMDLFYKDCEVANTIKLKTINSNYQIFDMQNKNGTILWKAFQKSNDYFSRLGGAGRYDGFQEYDIPALVVILLCEHLLLIKETSSSLRIFLPIDMWKKTDDLPEKVSNIISDIKLTTIKDKISLLKDFIDYFNSRNIKRLESLNWVKLQEEINHHLFTD